ncbi:signal recognition particle-docking protein FtsY [uncultured Roseibium sp.]|uniref:signal recognition particle-docking protein FtsY n=1 Tax=uncultured Roseibium sp. TaxID=1936171 RepID=UPI002622BA96|nr:signal recognition particle-docking protein FtsY [uncultured Roseibium sp.]
MSEKKRGFLGRLFGGKEAPVEQPEETVEKSSAEADHQEQAEENPVGAAEPELTTEMEVKPVAALDEPLKTFGLDGGPGIVPEFSAKQTPLPADDFVSTDVGSEPDIDTPLEEPQPAAEIVEPEEAPSEPSIDPEEPKLSWFQRLKKGLSRSSASLTEGISSIFTKRKLDASMLEELEDILIQADLGVDTAMAITDRLSDGRYNKEISPEEVREILSQEVEKVLEPVAQPLDLDMGKKPHVVLMVGVNGTGKTTTIGKLSKKLRSEGKKVMLAAGDTFRAAAVEQLKIWGERTGAEVIARDTGADAAGLAFDAMKEAQEKQVDVLLIDTAGRLQNKTELMDELEKVIRVIRKHDPEAPHTVLLTLDATTGQNALNQVEIFGKVAGVTGLVMTKLDGTARGGILVAIAAKHGLPVHFIGVGEGVEDLEPFSAQDFANAIAGLA